jgi:hypothetical protein
MHEELQLEPQLSDYSVPCGGENNLVGVVICLGFLISLICRQPRRSFDRANTSTSQSCGLNATRPHETSPVRRDSGGLLIVENWSAADFRDDSISRLAEPIFWRLARGTTEERQSAATGFQLLARV